MRKIKKNDDVIVIAGKDKGNRGSVLRVLGDYLMVGGINKVSIRSLTRLKVLLAVSLKKRHQFIFRM
jgi:ribosomal protein L24